MTVKYFVQVNYKNGEKLKKHFATEDAAWDFAKLHESDPQVKTIGRWERSQA